MTIIQDIQERELTVAELFKKTKEYVMTDTKRIISNGILLSLPAVIAYILAFSTIGVVLFSTFAREGAIRNIVDFTLAGISLIPMALIFVLVLILISLWHFTAIQTWLFKDLSGQMPGFKDTAAAAFKRTPRVLFTQLLVQIIVGFLSLIVPGILFFLALQSAPDLSSSFNALETQGQFDPSILTGIAGLLLPFLLLIVISALLGTYFMYAAPVAITRDTISPWQAVKRSVHIVKGRFWRVFGRVLAGGALLLASDVVMRMIMGMANGIDAGFGTLVAIVYTVVYALLSYFIFIYQFILFLNLDNSKPENPLVVS